MITTRSYINGDYKVIINSLGTKIRIGVGEAAFPESVDLKITGYCDAACRYCHESSTIKQGHAPFDEIIAFMNQMNRGTELAIGGGNPLAHPHIAEIIDAARSFALVPNVTINEKHIESYSSKYKAAGLGVSVSTDPDWNLLRKIRNKHDHVIYHVINRVHNPEILQQLSEEVPGAKALILGFKDYGFGATYHLKNDNEIIWQNINIPIYFDNLAIKQLDVQNKISEKIWESRYMGDDGTHTMFVDLVTNSFAKNSTSKRMPYMGCLKEAFETVKYG